ncbi:MAG: hypothetical protein ABSG46_10555 [Candidatus Binataceae bacterium]
MAAIPASQVPNTPPPGKAMVVFMRPSLIGSALKSPVFDVSVEPPVLVGIVSAKKKVAYITDPGVKRFMVVDLAEKAEFMDATLLAGKTYYACIIPRIGLWLGRFSFEPIGQAVTDKKLDDDLADTSWVANTPASFEWAQVHAQSIQAKQDEYLQPWLDEPDKPTLYAADGR